MYQDSVIIQCSACKTKNRVPKARLKDKPVCGKCKTSLPEMTFHSSPVMVSDANFKAEVLGYPGPVLLDCWAPWCGPCKMAAPVLDKLAGEYGAQVKICKVNVDENRELASTYEIRSIPALLAFKDGKLVDQRVGSAGEDEYRTWFNSLL